MENEQVHSRFKFSTLFKKIGVKRGLELGVGGGDYSEHLLNSYNFEELYGIDSWAEVGPEYYCDGKPVHDYKEYLDVVKRFLPCSNYILLRSTFKDGINFFDDAFFDFIFIDGAAGQGQENGKTFIDWWPKLRKGGVFSGRAYDKKFKPCVRAVDDFIERNNLELNILEEKEGLDFVQNWYVIKCAENRSKLQAAMNKLS